MRNVQYQQPQSAPVAARIGLLYQALNRQWHKQALIVFMIIVVAHWLEHLLQAFQIFVLGWARPHAHGALGLALPWLVKSEVLHYAYALLMLLGLVILRPAFSGEARLWWNIATIIQCWHHFEHALLLGQAITGLNLWGLPAPTSVLQMVIPRVELHLFYNAIVFLPMVIAMIYHHYAPASSDHPALCNCVRFRHEPISAG
jgi:hypothetical protein